MTDDEILDGWGVGPILEMSKKRMVYAAYRFEQLARERHEAGSHLWIAILGYLVSVPIQRGALLDPDTVTGPPIISCYLCQRDYTPGAEHTACTGSFDD